MTGDAPLQIGDMGFVAGEGEKLHMVLAVTEHTVRVKEWPIADAPPAKEILRSQFHPEGDRE